MPVYVDGEKKALIRFALPYKNGEIPYPGNENGKIRYNAATFMWIRVHYPKIPISRLWGVGFVGGQCVCF